MNESGDYSGTLVLVIRGWSDPVKTCRVNMRGGTIPQPFLELVRSTLPGAELLVPDLPMGTLSAEDPRDLVQNLLAAVDQRFIGRPFNSLIIVAFSAGTILAREFYSLACGAQLSGVLDPAQARPWASLVSRIVILAGLTRGWSVSSATPQGIRFVAPILMTLVNAWARLRRCRPAFIMQFKRGAPFVIEGRLKFDQVERYMRANDKTLPSTVFLLGSEDEFMSPADAMDLGPRNEYTYIEVPYSTHTAILEVEAESASTESDPSPKTMQARQRAELVRRALTQEPHEMSDIAMHHDDIDDYGDEMDRLIRPDSTVPVDKVQQVVFIVHGIRDNGFWTKRIAREIKTIARGRSVVIRAPSPSYGYFSMWDFVRFWGRKDATYWFLEKYAEIRVLYPDTPISYIGHSNGTYLATNALASCEMVKLDRILFAGSVVRTDFDWAALRGRVHSILNLVATNDLVVACLPGAFEQLGLRFFGVGGAGYYGFPERVAEPGPEVKNFRFLEGGHGIGISEALWSDIAHYVIDGRSLPRTVGASEPPRARPERRSVCQEQRAKWYRLVPIAAAVLGYCILATLIALLEGWALLGATALFVYLFIRFVGSF